MTYRAARLSTTRRDPRQAAFNRSPGRLGSNKVSHQPRAVQELATYLGGEMDKQVAAAEARGNGAAVFSLKKARVDPKVLWSQDLHAALTEGNVGKA